MLLLPGIKKKSAWQFVTCEGAALALGIPTASGGWVMLRSPANKPVKFYYGGAGAGYSWMFKIPKIGKPQISTPKGPLTGTGSEAAFTSTGEVYITKGFMGNELEVSDIEGICAFVEVGAGVVVGGSANGMLLGVDPYLLAHAATQMGHAAPLIDRMTLGTVDPERAARTVVEDVGYQQLFSSARAFLVMGGYNVGLQAGFGGAAYMGYLHS